MIRRRNLVLLVLFYFTGFQASGQVANFSQDTEMLNRQIKKALVYAQNPATLDSANYYLETFYGLAKTIRYDKGLVEYFRIKAVTYFVQQKQDSLSLYIEKALHEAMLTGNKKERALVIDLQGWIHQVREENDSATHFYIEALKIAESINESKLAGEISDNLSILFLSIGDNNKSAEYANIAYQNGLKLGDTLLITNGLFNLGNTKLKLKQFDTAMLLYRRVNELVTDPVKYNYVLYRALSNQASILNDEGKFDESIKTYKKVLNLLPHADSTIIPYVYVGLGNAQLKRGLYKDAENSLAKAISIAIIKGQKQSLRDGYLQMSELKEAQNNSSAALIYRIKYEALNDTLNNETSDKNMHLLERRYNTAKKDNQISMQQLALVKNKNIIQQKNILNLFLGAGFLLLVLSSIFVYRNFKNRQRLLEKEKLLQEAKIVELEKQQQLVAMQSVLKGQEDERSRLAKDLHDGVGGLLSGVKLSMSNMKGNFFLSEENANSFNNVISQLDQSIAELRRVSHNMMPEALVKYGLKEALENYCENLNLSGKIKVQLQIYNMEKRMEQNTEIVIYRIVQELLNNVIKHAEAKNVLIQLSREKDRFTLTVEDDGKGFIVNEKKYGAGLENIKARAGYLNGNIEILSKPGEGTSVNIDGNCT